MTTHEKALRIVRIYVTLRDRGMDTKEAIVGALQVAYETVIVVIHYAMCS